MKVGYPCINLSINCRSSNTFRLKNYSEKRLKETINKNLECLQTILEFNVEHKVYFFRITSDLIPFGSHPVMNFNWQNHFSYKFIEIGDYIKKNKIRISMHPGQYTVINSNKRHIFENAKKELKYHLDVLDLMNLKKQCLRGDAFAEDKFEELLELKDGAKLSLGQMKVTNTDFDEFLGER